jgi:hypothetical protein
MKSMYQVGITKQGIPYQSQRYMYVTELGTKYKDYLVFLGIGVSLENNMGGGGGIGHGYLEY